ncbi:hypothetical protein [Allocoleopsis sp.]|uniref:hypothetical protein n=1 Tax=Allocoleopsis sp. TaxID=3088169 RepID=UPI002FD27706
MKHLLADRPSVQNESLESEGKSRLDVIELNRDRFSKSLNNDKPDPRRTQADQPAQNTASNSYKRLPQPSRPATCVPIWQRMVQGAKWAVFSGVALAIGAMVLYEPSPAKREQAIAKNPSQTMPIPPLEVSTAVSPQKAAPLSDTALPQAKKLGKQPLTPTSPLQSTVPIPGSLALNSSPKSQDEPLSVNPSTDQIPSPKADLSSEPSLSGRNPGVPPTLPSNLLPVEPPCAGEGIHQQASSGSSDNHANTDEKSSVAEVKNYFKKGWQPPAGVKQTLEYSVSINADGTVQRIRPLSNAAGEYINSTSLPMPGSPFVSPREGGGNTNIYLAFSPDGKVNASLE